MLFLVLRRGVNSITLCNTTLLSSSDPQKSPPRSRVEPPPLAQASALISFLCLCGKGTQALAISGLLWLPAVSAEETQEKVGAATGSFLAWGRVLADKNNATGLRGGVYLFLPSTKMTEMRRLVGGAVGSLGRGTLTFGDYECRLMEPPGM